MREIKFRAWDSDFRRRVCNHIENNKLKTKRIIK